MIRTFNRVWRRLGSLGKPQGLPQTPGVYVVANSPRHARWLWVQAVEVEVGASLMRSISHDGPAPYQAHLLPPPPSTD